MQSYNFSTACNVHCSTTSWYKCSALNSGASLKRGRKFTTGISSRHESWQKIRHIPHPPHISTLPTCFPENPLLERISKISWRRTRKGAWERCRETFREMWWCLAGDHSLYRSPETSLLAAKSHKQGKSWLRPTAITTHLLRRLLGQTLGGNVWSFSISKIWFHELCETLESIFWWIWFNLAHGGFTRSWSGRRHLAQLPICQALSLDAPDQVSCRTFICS